MLRFGTTLAMMMASRVKRRSSRRGVIVNEHILTEDETRFHVDLLSRWFDFIHHEDLLDRLRRKQNRPFCLLTFDDGKRSNFTSVAPVLERLGIPAVFYLPTRFISDGTPLWFDRYDAVRQSLGYAPKGLELNVVKTLPLALLNELLDKQCDKHGIRIDSDSDNVRPMSWREVRDLAGRGFTIGAHGLRHAILTSESEEDALLEVEESIAEVTQELGARCSTFAFPNGNYTERLARHALHCGVTSVMTTEPTWVENPVHPWRLPRVQLFGDQSRSWIEAKLAIAATGFFLPNPDGTGRSYRRANRSFDGDCVK